MANRPEKPVGTLTRSTNPSHRSHIQTKTQVLRVVLILTFVSFITFFITLTSSHWIIITYPADFFAPGQQMFVARSTYGIIWECALQRPKRMQTFEKKCDYHQHLVRNGSITAEQTRVGMVRTMYSFSVIHIILVIITMICGWYSIREHRYTYKRLTGMIYILTAAALVVCIEMLSTIFQYGKTNLPELYPATIKDSKGLCYIIAWVIFSQLLLSSFLFFACSKKRKGIFDEETDEEALANRPVNLTRSFRS